MKGLIPGGDHTFGVDEQVPSRWLNLLQADDARLWEYLSNLASNYLLAAIHTSDNKMTYTASADTVTIGSGVQLTVAGLLFDTADLSSWDFTIPDSSTKYLRCRVHADSGELVDWDATPLVRDIKLEFYLSDDDSVTSGDDMLVLKAVKAGAGTTPTVTAYANTPAPAPAQLQQLVITASGTMTQGTDIPADALAVLVECWGGGGGGGGGAAGVGGGAGGGGGGYSSKLVTLSSGEVVTTTIGAGGAGGAANTIGTDGGTTSFGAHSSATGGGGGPASSCAAGAGGSGVGGDRNLTGGQGQANLVGAQGSMGGGSPLGAPMSGSGPVDGAAADAAAPGGGGQGGNDTTNPGGDGYRGEIVLTYLTREA